MPSARRGNPLEGLNVLALGASVATACAASWLAESGAHVAAFRPGWQTPKAGTTAAAFERQVSHLWRAADFAENAPYHVLLTDTAALQDLAPGIPTELVADIVTIEITSPLPSATGFEDVLLGDMTLWARSGLGYLTREIDENWNFGAPCLPRNRQASILAGMAAATAAVAAILDDREPALRPRHVAVDAFELLALMPMQPIAFAQLADRIVGREQGQPAPRFPGGTLPTANGMAYVRPVEPAHWAGLLHLVGGLDWAAEQVQDNPMILREAAAEIDQRIRDWALALTSEEIADLCQAEHIPVAPVYRPDQVVRDTHLAARGFFRTDEEQGGPGLNLPWITTIGDAADAPAKDTSSTEDTGAGAGARLRPIAARLDTALPLAGLRILDLSWAWAGPFATTLFADLGAEVVNIEWHPRASNLRRNPPFAGKRQESNNTAAWWSANQRGKFSIGVNLKTDEGKRVVRELAGHCDAVVENFSPGVVDRLGVGYGDLVQANPRLVYVSLSAFGQTGPHSHYIGYGTQVYAASGAGYATSQDGRTQSQMWIPYPDPVSGLAGAFAIAAHVHNARRTGCPARVDISEHEAIASVTLEPLLDALDGRSTAGHGDPASTPPIDSTSPGYLVVTTADGHFVALLSRTPDDRGAFQRALGADGATAEEIRAAATALDAQMLLERATVAGLHAAPIRNSAEVLEDPYLAERGFWVQDQSPEVALDGIRIGGSVWRLDGHRAPIWRGAPPIFSDTRTVIGDLLGYAPATIDDLIERGVIA